MNKLYHLGLALFIVAASLLLVAGLEAYSPGGGSQRSRSEVLDASATSVSAELRDRRANAEDDDDTDTGEQRAASFVP